MTTCWTWRQSVSCHKDVAKKQITKCAAQLVGLQTGHTWYSVPSTPSTLLTPFRTDCAIL